MGFTKIYDAQHIAKANARNANRAAVEWYANQEFSHICWTCKAMYSCKNADLISGTVQATHICPECAAKQNFGQFFVDLSQFVAEREAARTQKAADKKAAAHAEKLASLVILGRATFKATAAVLFGVQSGEKIYHLTMIDGKIRSCADAATGESCKSRQYSGRCVHEERVMRYESQRAEDLAVAAQVAPLVLGEQFAEDLQAHLEDEMPALPVVVRTLEGHNVYVLTPDDKYECVRAADLDYFYPEHREATDAEILYLNSAEGPLRQGRQVARASYRDMYAADYNDVA